MPVINTQGVDFSIGTIIEYNKKAIEWAKVNNPSLATVISGLVNQRFLIKDMKKERGIITLGAATYPDGNILYSWKLSKEGKGNICPHPIFIRSKSQ